MKIIYLNEESTDSLEASCVALGFFDGLHVGHQELIYKVISMANEKQLKKGLLTFNYRPKDFLAKDKTTYLSALEDKVEILEAYDFDYLFVLEFNESLMKLSPEKFIDTYIIPNQMKSLVCGYDYRFGHLGSGNGETLKALSNGRYEVSIVNQRALSERKVASSYIREALEQGDVVLANTLLGRPYKVTGEVIYGFQRGKKELGFATANVAYGSYVIPKRGVYAVTILVAGTWYYGMANIGINPTFGGLQKDSLEVHIFDFDDMIYGDIVQVCFCEHIRDEKKFTSKEELIQEIESNNKKIKSYFVNQQER